MNVLEQRQAEAVVSIAKTLASLSVRLIDGSLYIAYGCTLIHKFSIDNSVAEVINQINEIRRMNL